MSDQNEQSRLASLRDYGVLDTPPEEAFDRITRVAADIFDTPIALISLIDAERQWFKSRYGIDATETPREIAFCDHAVRMGPHEVMVVDDATKDPRFAHNPFVTDDPSVRFYAGAVLTSPDGQNLGTLCVVDNKARHPTPEQLSRLRALADVVVDELELHRAGRKLDEQRRLLELAERMSGVGHWRVDAATGDVSWSDEVYRIHGVSRDSYNPALDTAVTFFSDEDQARVGQMVAHALATGGGFELATPLRRADGEMRDVISRGECQHDGAGKITGLVGVFQDVTEQNRRMEALREAQAEAEAASVAKSEFLANMSHELRTPLTSVLGFADLAAAQPGLSSTMQHFVERVRDASQALLSTVNDILDFSKLEAGQVAISPKPTRMAQMCRATLDLLTPQAAAKDLHLSFETDAEGDPAVNVDPDRVRQVLLNLIGNAVKFTQAGRVDVRLRHAADDRLLIEVQDTGPGISPQNQQRLFQRFSQVDGSLARQFGGTGLGLAICKGLVEAMGGELGVVSDVGQGSRFWFSIPAPVSLAPAADASRAGPADPLAGEGLRLLFADDHAANRDLASLILQSVGAEVTLVDDGAKAVALAGEAPFDVIVLDLRMPVMDGPAACEAIRLGDGPNACTPILAFTADPDSDELVRDPVLGFNAVVAKPINASALVAAVVSAAHFGAEPSVQEPPIQGPQVQGEEDRAA